MNQWSGASWRALAEGLDKLRLKVALRVAFAGETSRIPRTKITDKYSTVTQSSGVGAFILDIFSVQVLFLRAVSQLQDFGP